MAADAEPTPFTHPTSAQQAEAMFTALELTAAVIEKALTVLDQEDARIATQAHDPTHRGVNRWGHGLATLRGELANRGWDWERIKPKLRSVLAPGRHIQVCVAAARWIEGIPQTLPRGWHTIEAVQTNRQMVLPGFGQPPGTPVLGTVTWILCFQPVVHAAAEPGGPVTIEYRYELSEPKDIIGSGNRKRVVDWRLRCFQGSISFERKTENLRRQDEYDYDESTDGIDDDLIEKK